MPVIRTSQDYINNFYGLLKILYCLYTSFGRF